MADRPTEVELKLAIDRDQLDALIAHPLLKDIAPERQRLRSVYFDTPKRRLASRGVSLRVRSTGRRQVQTVKSIDGSGLFARGEWESEITGSGPDFGAAAGTPAEVVLSRRKHARKVRPIAASDIDRRTWRLWKGGSEIELTLDEGMLSAGSVTKPICEVELELKTGEPQELFRVARRLNEKVPLRLAVESKSERGLALAEAPGGTVRGREPIPLKRRMTAGAALSMILRQGMRHYRLNETVLLASRNPEALHQCRVALRRLRTAFGLFAKAVRPDPVAGTLRDRLRRSARLLGEARNLDVYLARHDLTLAARRAAEIERSRIYEAVIARLASAEMRSLFIDLADWVETGSWKARPQARRRLLRIATRRMRRWRRQIREAGRHLRRKPAREVHQVRIRVKRLRYACEFLAVLYATRRPKRFSRFMRACQELQEALGVIQDRHAADDLGHMLGLAGVRGRRSPAPADERSVPDADADMDAAVVAYRGFRAAKTFW
jgi:triphosphatase